MVGASAPKNRARAAAQNNGIRLERADPIPGGGPRDHLGVNAKLTDSSNDELRVLAAKIDDVNGLMGH